MQQVQIHLRLPPALHEAVKRVAAEQAVSINQAIVLLIASGTGSFSFDQDGRHRANGPPMTTTHGDAHEQQHGRA